MKVKAIGLDLAKNVFQVHGVDERERKLFNRQIKHAQMMEFFVRQPPCFVAMEACGSAHYWARKLAALGHTTKLIAPQHVKRFVKTNKNDAVDAAAISEAALRHDAKFVAVKSPEQQAIGALHALRDGAMKARNATGNRLRGLLLEFGVRIPKGVTQVSKHVPQALEDASNELPAVLRIALLEEYEQFKALDARIDRVHRQIEQWHRASVASKALTAVPGIGVLTATALVAHAGDPDAFANGRQVSAWLGIVPKQNSSGGKTQLLGISKCGNTRLRTLLIHGARSAVQALKRKLAAGVEPGKLTSTERWLVELLKRRNANVVCVALANKNARTSWAILKHGRPYEPGHVSLSPRARAALALS